MDGCKVKGMQRKDFRRKVIVYDDGKIGRPTKATIVRCRGKRKLIRFFCDWMEEDIEVWFVKRRRDGGGVYEHSGTNTWFYESRETDSFKIDCKDWLNEAHYSEYYL